jgi:hypothetical protein
MKLAIALATVLVLLGASSADAAWFGLGYRLPKPIDTPIIRPKVKDTHKYGKKQRHPAGWSLNAVQSEAVRG